MTLIRGVATIQFLAACVLYSIHQDLKQHLVFVLLIQGGFQMYMRVSHFPGEAGSPDFSPPFTDPLIDEAFTEFSLPATLFPDRFMPQSQILDAVGEFGRVVLQVQANVHCAQNWNGSSCETLCTTSNGIATCTQGQ